MKEKLLSIVIPAFNSAKYIENCIDSIEGQTFLPSYEIIIINDASTDNTEYIVSSRKKLNRNIILINNDKNVKQGVARNQGLKYARGKYVLFVDSDDVLNKNFLKEMLADIDDYSLVMCGIKKIFRNKTVIEDSSKLVGAENSIDLVRLYLTGNVEADVSVCNKIFDLGLLRENNIKFVNRNFFEDSLFVLKYLLVIDYNSIKYIEEPLYIYNKYNSQTTSVFNRLIDTCAIQYVDEVVSLSECYFFYDEKLLCSFTGRTFIHCVHHHIKYDIHWNKSKLEKLKNKFPLKCSSKELSFKYKIALFLINYFPNIYASIYKRRMK